MKFNHNPFQYYRNFKNIVAHVDKSVNHTPRANLLRRQSKKTTNPRIVATLPMINIRGGTSWWNKNTHFKDRNVNSLSQDCSNKAWLHRSPFLLVWPPLVSEFARVLAGVWGAAYDAVCRSLSELHSGPRVPSFCFPPHSNSSTRTSGLPPPFPALLSGPGQRSPRETSRHSGHSLPWTYTKYGCHLLRSVF